MELKHAMRKPFLMLFIAASTAFASAQAPAKPAAPAKTAAPAATATHSTASHPAASSTAVKLPPGIPPVKGIVKTAFVERWEDITVGSGADAEPNKLYKVLYTGYLAADGKKFDASSDHPGPPLKDKDGKPVLGDDGKPKLGDPQPMPFPQGFGRLIPGFDQGFGGMKVGGKRRLFIPWQLAYGEKGRPGPDAAHPGIPPKADLIFDVELVEVTDLPAAPTRPAMVTPGGKPPVRPGTPGAPPSPAQPGTPAPGAAPGAAPNAAAPPPAAAPATTAAPATPAAPSTQAAPATPPSTTAPAQPQSK
jgi:peptidylprolyl isomerase